jgi:hypothetical protein
VGKHIGLPLHHANTKTTIINDTTPVGADLRVCPNIAHKNDTNPVGVDLCVYPHVANRTVSKRITTGRHVNKNRTVSKRNTTGRHIGLPLQHANDDRTVSNYRIVGKHANTKTTIKNGTIPVGADLRVCPNIAHKNDTNPVGVDLCVYLHVANKTVSKRNTTGRHIGLPLRHADTETTIINDIIRISKWYKT